MMNSSLYQTINIHIYIYLHFFGLSKYKCHKDKDKDKDVFIGPKEFVSHMMMTQTKDRLYHQLKKNL